MLSFLSLLNFSTSFWNRRGEADQGYQKKTHTHSNTQMPQPEKDTNHKRAYIAFPALKHSSDKPHVERQQHDKAVLRQ